MSKLTRTTTLVAFLIGGSALAAAGAYAEMRHAGMGHGPGRDGGRFFDRIDANHDGVVTQSEVTAFTDARLKEFDGNHDGQITRAEFDTARQAKRAERQEAFFKRLDTNGDGSLSEEEFRNMRAHRGSKGRHDGA
jgi:hypothetical protein